MLKFRYVVPIVLLLLSLGCTSSKPTSLPPPALTVTETQYLGDAVSGPRAGALPADAASAAMLAQVRIYAATRASTESLDSLGAAVRLVVSMRDRQPVLATGQLTSTARWATGQAAEALANQLDSAPLTEVVKIREIKTAVARGASASIATSDDRAHRAVQLLVTNVSGAANAGQCEISLGIAGSSQDELAILRPIAVGDGFSAALLIPFTASGSPAKYLIAIVHVSPAPTPPDDAFTALLDQGRKDVEKSSTSAEQRLKDRLASPKNWPTFDAVRSAASDPKTRRAGMVYLATQTGATLSRDVYLVADDATLGKMLEDVAARIAGASGTDRSDAALAWLLDSATLQALGKMLSDNQLSPELAAVLTDYAGEAGRHAGSIEEITRKLSTRVEFDKRLIAENAIYLEDNSPAVRVRAYDWLNSRGKAPANFDPFGSPRQRRDALQAGK